MAARIGIFDHLSANRGGGQLVVARMAAELARDFSVEVIHDGAGYRLDGHRCSRSIRSR